MATLLTPQERKQRRRESHRRWAGRNKEKLAAYKSTYNKARYMANRNEIREKQRVWYLENRETMRLKGRIYRLKNLDVRRQKCRDWHASNKHIPAYIEDKKSRSKSGYIKNKTRVLAQHKLWRKTNPGHWRALRQKRRALEKNAAINLAGIKGWMKSIRAKESSSCYYCGDMTPSKSIHFDHIVPLCKGGGHCVENLCVSCAPCNLSKGQSLVQSWRKVGQLIFPI